ncbi:carbohydrate ABC transporter permease [Cucumibacter marinus]|uniref:carbohydrate ABC transporter permease n=1 Tax=Cucumibacter marinus TaxID=1121252 RepID=UPI000427043E|nr:carbohydrate ABC transporter permease [Cucumibacter marinus]
MADIAELPSKRARRIGGTIAVRLAIIVLCVLWITPTLGLFVSSFRTEFAIQTSGWWTTLLDPFNRAQWTLDNYARVITGEGMGQAFVNTIAVTVPAVVFPILVAAYAAYAFSWIEFRFREFFFALFIMMIVVPLQLAFIPLLRAWTALDLSNSLIAIWITHAGFAMPIALLILRNFIAALPAELIEAAKMENANHFQIFWRVVFPLALPAIAAFGVFHFLWIWNDFLVALVFLGGNPDVQVVTMNLQKLLAARGSDWHLLAAAAFVTMIVPVSVFLALQRYFVRGMLAGAVKG